MLRGILRRGGLLFRGVRAFAAPVRLEEGLEGRPLRIWTDPTTDDPQHTLSFARGFSNEPLLCKTLGSWFEEQVHTYSSQEVLYVKHQDNRYSWTELNEEVDRLITGFQRLGLEAGDRFAICLPNCSQWVAASLACFKTGVILVNINPAYRAYELRHALNLVGAKALLLQPSLKTTDYLSIVAELAPELPSSTPGHELQLEQLPALKHLILASDKRMNGYTPYTDLLGDLPAKRGSMVNQRMTVHSPANIQFTSGTTGAPKGATLTHMNILNNGYFTGKTMHLTPSDALCIPVPLYHCFGLVLGNLAAMSHGARIVYASELFEPGATLQTASDERCTALHGVPTMFIGMLNHPLRKTLDLSNLRTGIMAGAPAPLEVMKSVMSDMHLRDMTICYGMTETSPVSFQTKTTDPVEKMVETIGRILPHVEAKIIDDVGNVLPVGHPGELCTRGYLVMSGYWGQDDKTREVIDDQQWMHTGDLATMDDEGYVTIVGRKKDVVIRGGENIYPREIEEFLFTHEHIESVQAVGVPDKKYGEELCVWVKVKEGAKEVMNADQVRAYCKANIAHYKVPRYVHFCDDFPMTITGKPQKFIIQDKSIEIFGLQDQA
mmetsp:Transcript_1806/g.6454  ORF Transcript_1806/g.6454 Transcript_1806/m.6454 type:complete len:606 (-) Transcript_1806:36-1853(-)